MLDVELGRGDGCWMLSWAGRVDVGCWADPPTSTQGADIMLRAGVLNAEEIVLPRRAKIFASDAVWGALGRRGQDTKPV